MISAASAAAQYGAALTDRCNISGARLINGVQSIYAAEDLRCRLSGYAPAELIGDIIQGDQRLILFAPDCDDQNFPIPIKGDKVVHDGKTLTVQACDANTRRIGTETIAYECQVRG